MSMAMSSQVRPETRAPVSYYKYILYGICIIIYIIYMNIYILLYHVIYISDMMLCPLFLRTLGTFPDANCGPDTHVHDCCSVNHDAEGFNMNDNSTILLLGLIATYGELYMRLNIYLRFICPYSFISNMKLYSYQTTSGQIIYIRMQSTAKEREERSAKMIPSWVKELPHLFQKIFSHGILAFILPMIMVPIYMNQSVQSSMSVSSRNALLGAQAFMEPYKNVFQFIEVSVLLTIIDALAFTKYFSSHRCMFVSFILPF